MYAAFEHYATANPVVDSIFHVSQPAWIDFVKDVGIPVPRSTDCQAGRVPTPLPIPILPLYPQPLEPSTPTPNPYPLNPYPLPPDP